MDAFESIVEGIFRQKHYWTWRGFKVNVTKAEKVAIGKHSMPRVEIDILAYQPVKNELLWIECKSYLDSSGVNDIAFDVGNKYAGRYKIFTDENYRKIASQSLMAQLIHDELIRQDTKLKFCLVAGRTYAKTRELLKTRFDSNEWILYDEQWIREQLQTFAKLGYENDVAIMVAKLLMKD